MSGDVFELRGVLLEMGHEMIVDHLAGRHLAASWMLAHRESPSLRAARSRKLRRSERSDFTSCQSVAIATSRPGIDPRQPTRVLACPPIGNGLTFVLIDDIARLLGPKRNELRKVSPYLAAFPGLAGSAVSGSEPSRLLRLRYQTLLDDIESCSHSSIKVFLSLIGTPRPYRRSSNSFHRP